VQQFRADSGTGFVTATMAAAGCSMQFVLPNRAPLPATREAGLVQIAEALIDGGLVLTSRLGASFRERRQDAADIGIGLLVLGFAFFGHMARRPRAIA
jgi:hypothetical protein